MLTFTVRGVFIGVNMTSTDLERSVWHQVVASRTGEATSTNLEKSVRCQVVAGWPSHVVGLPVGAASTDFLHRLALPLLV